MDRHSDEPRDISPWSVLPVGARVRVGGRLGWVRARHFMFAVVCYDGEADAAWHIVPIGRCVQLEPNASP